MLMKQLKCIRIKSSKDTRNLIFISLSDRICGVMVKVLASSALDRGFEPWSGQTKDYKIVASLLSMQH